MRVQVQAVHQVTDELVDAAGRLLPQLSNSAAPLDAEGLARITSHQAITLFIARSQDVIVGMLTLVTFPLPTGLRARIEDVVVDQAARGHRYDLGRRSSPALGSNPPSRSGVLGRVGP
jgi:hypothetical protein